MDDSTTASGETEPSLEQELETRWALWGLALGIAMLSLAYLIVAPSPWAEGLDTSWEVKESIRTRSWVIIGLWSGAAINFVLALTTLLFWKFRPKMIDSPPSVSKEGQGEKRGRRNWGLMLLILGAMGVSGTMMAPRLSLGLWGDEDATTRRFLIGHVYRMEDDQFIIKEPTWMKTVWNFDTGTNSHLLYNVLGRLSHGSADISGSDPDSFYFDTVRIRLPSFLATLALIPTAAWLVSLLGFARGAPLTAFLVALHPWIVRFGSDARGYALQMLFGMLAVALLFKAFQSRHRARWWLGFGICQALALSSHMSTLYLLLPLNFAGLMAAWAPWQEGQRNPFKVANVWRLAGGSLLGGMMVIQGMLPIALQLPGYLERGRLQGELSEGFVPDWISFWVTGSPWREWNQDNPFSLTWKEVSEVSPIATVSASLLLVCLFLVGVIALLRAPFKRWWLLPLLAPTFLLIADAIRSENILYPWYTVGFLSFALVIVGTGFGALFSIRKLPGSLPPAVIPCLAGALVVGLFAKATAPQRELYRNHPVEPTGEAVSLTRKVVDPFHPQIDEVLTLGFVHASRLYDPAMIMADNDEEFIEGLREAERRGVPLSVNAANLGLGPIYFPLATKMIYDRDVFEAPIVIHGLQNPCSRYVFKYRPGGLSRFEARQAIEEAPPGEN